MPDTVRDLSPPPQLAPFRTAKSETVHLTRELVKKMRALPPSPTERELDVRRKEYLLARLREGTFHSLLWVTGEVDGVVYRVNGQHSSAMLLELGDEEFPKDLTVHTDHLICNGMAGLVMAFRQYDNRASARKPLDIAGAYQGIEGDLGSVPRWLGKLGIEGIVWYEKFVARHDVPTGDDVYSQFAAQENHAFLLWLATVFQGRVNGVTIPPVIAAIWATYRADPESANLFWSDIRDQGREFEAEHPTSTLWDWLDRLHRKEMVVKPLQKYQGVIYGWNAYREGRETIRDIRCDIRRNMLRPL
jgi:hypothetical protein